MSTPNQFPMRPQIGRWDCEGGVDTDTPYKHLQRPFSHHNTSRDNWKRVVFPVVDMTEEEMAKHKLKTSVN